MTKRLILNINGVSTPVDADPKDSLASVLREQLELTGTKVGCGAGQCGACSVMLDGKVVRSCHTRMERVPDNASIVTIEGIARIAPDLPPASDDTEYVAKYRSFMARNGWTPEVFADRSSTPIVVEARRGRAW